MEPGPRDLTVINEVWLDECYSHFIPQDDWVVVDVGAHKGAYTAWVRRYAPDCELLAFEPEPTNYRLLRENTERLKGKPVRCFHAAVGSVATENVTIIKIAGMSGWSTLYPDRAARLVPPVAATSVVEQFSLSQVVTLAGGHVDLMKLDVEGSEYDLVLDGSSHSWRKVKRLMMEVDLVSVGGGHSVDDIRSRLLDLGFHLEQIEERLIAGYRVGG